MLAAQHGLRSVTLARPADAAPAEEREPITLAMRAMHHLSSYTMARPCVLRNAAPLVSFTFDDVPDSAISRGARVLEEFGARGTFFVSTGLLGRRTPDWRLAGPEGIAELAEAGHEVALHSHRHRPLAAMKRRDFVADLRLCAISMARLAPGRVSANFAYPFGFGHFGHRGFLDGVVRSSRTTHPGLNIGRSDLHFLKSWAFGSTLHEPDAVDRLLEEAAARGGWLILTGHDVADRPSPYGCTPQLLAHALRRTAALGITVAPIDTALDLCGADPMVSPLVEPVR
jgi:peptidoglycan/xylan/chitin deacetylase (PgdA/CDA1 family)